MCFQVVQTDVTPDFQHAVQKKKKSKTVTFKWLHVDILEMVDLIKCVIKINLIFLKNFLYVANRKF